MDSIAIPTETKAVIVDPHSLQPDTLARLAREFILRESHENGSFDRDMTTEVAKVIYRLKSGECLISFDPATESVGVVLAKDFQNL
jgi:uncharacterized protein YheU (UPF0270 family)